MKERTVAHYVKRPHKDYSMSFKLQVVGEVERGELTIGGAPANMGFKITVLLPIGCLNMVTLTGRPKSRLL